MKKKDTVKTYAVKHMDKDVVENSRSGGIFTALSDFILSNQGVVYGCVLDDEFRAIHIRAIDFETRNLMRGSKYVQSKLGNTFQRVKEDLVNEKMVLFSGTSCQVAGLKAFLGQEYENLLCIDIVCHGVPSPQIWREYLNWQEKKHSSKVANVQFRNKRDFGWASHVETITMENGKCIHSKIFTKLFYDHNILRPSCYECPYKSIIHPGDITIADYWGIEKAAPEFHDNKGVSLVLVNNEKGANCFDTVKDEVIWKSTRIEDSLQEPLIKPYEEPKERKIFWDNVKNKPFSYIIRRYGEDSLFTKAKRKVKNIIMRVIKRNGK